MYIQLSIKDLVKAILARLKASGIPCYDVVPQDAVPPYCYVQVTRTYPDDTKTMYCKSYDVWVHVFADENAASHVPIYQYIEAVEEAMTEEIELSEPYYLVTQIDTGLQTMQEEENGSSHAVIGFTFKISYGYKVKNF